MKRLFKTRRFSPLRPTELKRGDRVIVGWDAPGRIRLGVVQGVESDEEENGLDAYGNPAGFWVRALLDEDRPNASAHLYPIRLISLAPANAPAPPPIGAVWKRTDGTTVSDVQPVLGATPVEVVVERWLRLEPRERRSMLKKLRTLIEAIERAEAPDSCGRCGWPRR